MPRSAAGGAFELQLSTFDPDLSGREIAAELWDTAEGATKIEVLAPTGPGTWSPVMFDFAVDGTPTGDDVMSVENGGSQLPYNGKLLSLTFRLPASLDPTIGPWKLRYTFLPSSADRTTWTLRVLP